MLAMARPVIVSDLAAGSDTVLAPPAVTEDRMTGWRFRSGDDAELAATLIRLLSASESTRLAVGRRPRDPRTTRRRCWRTLAVRLSRPPCIATH